MILFSGYSTMPRAPAALRRGTMWRTTLSSMIVFTATQNHATATAYRPLLRPALANVSATYPENTGFLIGSIFPWARRTLRSTADLRQPPSGDPSMCDACDPPF